MSVLLKPQSKISGSRYVYIGETDKCGLGVFAAKDFLKGEIVSEIKDPEYYNSAITYAEIKGRGYTHADIFQVGSDLFIPPYGNIDDFTNHSCNPSTGIRLAVDGYSVVALRDIRRDEEITYDYSTYQDCPEEDMACLCGAPNCRGVVRSFSTLPPMLQRRYIALGVVGEFVLAEAEPRRLQAAGGHGRTP